MPQLNRQEHVRRLVKKIRARIKLTPDEISTPDNFILDEHVCDRLILDLLRDLLLEHPPEEIAMKIRCGRHDLPDREVLQLLFKPIRNYARGLGYTQQNREIADLITILCEDTPGASL